MGVFQQRWRLLNEAHRMPRLVTPSMLNALEVCFHSLTDVVSVLAGVYAQRTFKAWTDAVAILPSVETQRRVDASQSNADLEAMSPTVWWVLRSSILNAMTVLNRSPLVRKAMETSLEIAEQ